MNWCYQLYSQLHWLIQCQVFALFCIVSYSILDHQPLSIVSSLQDFRKGNLLTLICLRFISRFTYSPNVSVESKHLLFPHTLCSFSSLIGTHLIYFVSIVAELKYLLQSQFQLSLFLSLLIGPMIPCNSRRQSTAMLISFRYQTYQLDQKGQHLFYVLECMYSSR